jgi:hypothetical protein
MHGPGTADCTVSLTGAAGSGGLSVSLLSSSADVAIPASVTVPATADTAAFKATVSAVAAAQTVTLTASAGSASASFALQLNPDAPTLTVATSGSPSLYGSGVTFTATISSGPTGTVTFYDGSGSIGVAAIVGTSAALTTAALAAGSHAITATWPGNSSYPAVTSSAIAQVVNPATPTLSINAGSVSFGQVPLNLLVTQTVTLASTGSAPVTVSSAAVTGTGFSLAGAAFSAILSPGQTANLGVQFDPASVGTADGQLTIVSNSSGGVTVAVPLSGTGAVIDYAVELTWDAPEGSADPIAGYNVYRSMAGASEYQLLNPSVDALTAYLDSSIQPGQTYVYLIESVDSSGIESAPSALVAVTVP